MIVCWKLFWSTKCSTVYKRFSLEIPRIPSFSFWSSWIILICLFACLPIKNVYYKIKTASVCPPAYFPCLAWRFYWEVIQLAIFKIVLMHISTDFYFVTHKWKTDWLLHFWGYGIYTVWMLLNFLMLILYYILNKRVWLYRLSML